MNRTKLDLWVGVFVAIGIAALLFLSLKVGNLSAGGFAKTYVVEAEFDNIGGLKPRAPVKSAGVVVGRVADIQFDTESYRALVVLSLNEKFSFPKDTIASILTSGLLGEQFVGLDAGGDEAMLKAGERIKITQSAVVLEKLISQFLFSKASEAPAAAATQ